MTPATTVHFLVAGQPTQKVVMQAIPRCGERVRVLRAETSILYLVVRVTHVGHIVDGDDGALISDNVVEVNLLADEQQPGAD